MKKLIRYFEEQEDDIHIDKEGGLNIEVNNCKLRMKYYYDIHRKFKLKKASLVITVTKGKKEIWIDINKKYNKRCYALFEKTEMVSKDYLLLYKWGLI